MGKGEGAEREAGAELQPVEHGGAPFPRLPLLQHTVAGSAAGG